jgi:hypothetical protein
MTRRTPEQVDYQQLMRWADVYRAVGGHAAGWQPPALVSDRDHPFPRQMAPVRVLWCDRIRDRWRRLRGNGGEAAR